MDTSKSLNAKNNDYKWVNVHVSLMIAHRLRQERVKCDTMGDVGNQSIHCVDELESSHCVMKTQPCITQQLRSNYLSKSIL